MIPRTLEQKLLELAGYYPVVVVTGPRQSGKTTLCQIAFPGKTYVSLEALDTREFALSDPRGFLAEYADGAIIDEIQPSRHCSTTCRATSTHARIRVGSS